jgi:hypothetical protein
LRTRGLPSEKARVYAEKARRYEAAAHAAYEGGNWDPAVSAAVHAVINAVDAACVSALGHRAAADDHEAAVGLLLQVSTLEPAKRGLAAKHFKALLALKHAAEYEDRLCEESEARRALQSLGRALAALRSSSA